MVHLKKLEKKILIKVNKNKVLQDYFKQEKIKFQLKDKTTVEDTILPVRFLQD